MVLTEEKIEKNISTFVKTGEKYGFVNDEFIELYGEDLMNAPASMTEEGHNCFNGGLVDHIIRMTAHALKINDGLAPSKQVGKESLIKVCFLHQIGKAKMFKPNTSSWHLERGINFAWNEETIALKVAENSIKYIMNTGIKLTEDEYDAIMLYGGEFTNRPLKSEGERISSIVKAANIIAIIEEK